MEYKQRNGKYTIVYFCLEVLQTYCTYAFHSLICLALTFYCVQCFSMRYTISFFRFKTLIIKSLWISGLDSGCFQLFCPGLKRLKRLKRVSFNNSFFFLFLLFSRPHKKRAKNLKINPMSKFAAFIVITFPDFPSSLRVLLKPP